jgi:putative spermidine/putrescine transport system permease protein
MSTAKNQARIPYLLMAPAVIVVMLCFVVPIGNTLLLSVSDPKISMANYERIFSTSLYLRVLANTFKNAAIVTAVCLVLAYPLAYSIVRRGAVVASILLIAVAIPFWTGFLVRTFSWLIIFGKEGPVAQAMRVVGITPPKMLFTSFTALWGMTHILLPYMVMALYGVMKQINLQQLKAAESLGASPAVAFWQVFVPQSLPGVLSGCVLVFTMCLGFYVTPVLLGTPTDMMLAQLIGEQVQELLAWGFAAALSVVLMGATFLVLAIYGRFFGLQKLWG